MQGVENVRQRRQIRLLQELIDRHDIKIDELGEALDNEHVGDLIAHGLEAAEHVRSEQKLRLLGEIVSAGLERGISRSKFERAHLLLNLIGPLEAVHIHVLMVLASPISGRGQPDGLQVSGGLASDELLERVSALDEVVEPVVGMLVSQGLVHNAAAGTYGGLEGAELWSITNFGRWLIEHLDDKVGG